MLHTRGLRQDEGCEKRGCRSAARSINRTLTRDRTQTLRALARWHASRSRKSALDPLAISPPARTSARWLWLLRRRWRLRRRRANASARPTRSTCSLSAHRWRRPRAARRRCRSCGATRKPRAARPRSIAGSTCPSSTARSASSNRCVCAYCHAAYVTVHCMIALRGHAAHTRSGPFGALR